MLLLSFGADYSDLNLASEFNTYCFERTKDKITWTLNNETARVIVREEHNSTNFPYRSDHRLAKIAFSFWDGGSGSQGTSDWSGGPTNWENPHNPDYRMFVDWVSVECYDSQGIDPASVSSFLPPLKTAKTSSTTTSLFVEATPTIAAASTETEVHSTQSMVPAANPGSSSSGTSSGSRRTESPWTAMIIAEVLAIALLAGVYNL